MDRNVVTATVLITLILLVWFYFITPPPPPPGDSQPADSTLVSQDSVDEVPDTPIDPETSVPLAAVDSTIAGAQEGEARIVTVDTDLYEAQFSTKGATLVSFTLKKFNQFDQVTPVQIVDTTKTGALGLFFTTPASHNVDTRTFFFDVDREQISLAEGEGPATLTFSTPVGNGEIRQTYTFTPGSYEVGLSIEQENAESYTTRDGYELFWDGGIPFSEGNHETEAIKTASYARTGTDVVGITLDGETYEEQGLRGEISWVGVKNQYFASIIMPSGEHTGC